MDAYPGSFNADNTVFSFTPVIYTTGKGQEKIWHIKISLYEDNNIIPINKDIIECPNYNFKFNLGSFKPKPPSAYKAVYWTEHGMLSGTLSRSDDTIVDVGKNIGKKNETNVLQQAFKDCLSKHKDKIKKSNVIADASAAEDTNKMYPPMLVTAINSSDSTTWADSLYAGKNVVFQPKFNGHRCVAFYNDITNEVCLYSRGMTLITFAPLIKQLTAARSLLITPEGNKIYLDGELYSPGMSLQDISSLVRTQKEIDKTSLKFYIFDLFVPKTPDIPYGNRLDLLSKLMPKLTEYSSFIMPVDTIFVENCKMASIKAQEYIKIGYEGGIVRRTDKPYEFSYNGKHSNYLCKIKNRQDGEFEITGYVYGGKGRHQNLIKWEVKNDAGRKFHVSMNISDEENMNLGAKFTKNPEAFTKNFLGKYVTILYAEMSEDGIPLQSKATNYFRHPNHEEAEEYEKLNALYEELKI